MDGINGCHYWTSLMKWTALMVMDGIWTALMDGINGRHWVTTKIGINGQDLI